MKRSFKPPRRVVKGMPSAVVFSILIHAVLFLLAGMLVVFTVVKKEEKKFVPTKAVERPKMKLRKPKVKVKKNSKPKPTTRIVTKINRPSMPDIQLPEMSGMGGEGFGGGIEGFDIMPDLSDPTFFGDGQSIGNDFVGTFYDFKRDRSGRPIPMDPDMFAQKLRRFIDGGWDASKLARYYRSPRKLYTTTFLLPPMFAYVGPRSFGENEADGWLWIAHYKGKLVHKDGITFRFRGHGDDFMLVRVNGEIVLRGNYPGAWRDSIGKRWDSTSADSRKYRLGNQYAEVGDWITLEPGVPLDMELLIGEIIGGGFCAMLVVEEKGVEYERNFQGGPILPIFKTAEPSLDLTEAIHSKLIEGEACVANGPVFCDYDSQSRAISYDTASHVSSNTSLACNDSDDAHIRTWTTCDGSTLEAEFLLLLGDQVVLRDPTGKQRKIRKSRFCDEDLKFIELARPPKFNFNFSKRSSQRKLKQSPFSKTIPPVSRDYVFGAKLRQTSAGSYGAELQVEFFAVGEEIDGDNYILFDRQEAGFVPAKEPERAFEFYGKRVELEDYNIYGMSRGEKYGGYLVVVTDSRGKIIDHGTSHKWLFENLENLKQIPVGKHFDKTCTRVGPPRPKRNY